MVPMPYDLDYRNTVRHISLCLFWRDSCSARDDDGGRNVLLFSDDCGLFEWSRGCPNKI